ncbi:hypothetical protein LXL04_006203 [Taraxacum kok-saghyz]
MYSNRGRGHPSYRGGYGRGRGNPPSASSNSSYRTGSSSNSQSLPIPGSPLYEEFKEFLKTKENIPSFAKAITDGDTVDDTLEYKELPHKDHIIILENKDIMLYFENNDDPWFLMSRYLDTASYAGFSYKNRNYYENILKVTESVEFSHFTSGGNTNIYNFSKAIIKKIILAEEWGLSTLKEREFMMPPSKTPVKFTYWDYIESFHKAFLYENPQRKHTWFFKVCENVYKHNKEIPNWFTNWWISYGPRIDILPEDPFRNLYGEWITVSPRYSKHLTQKTGGALEVISSLHFFMEFSIPWIWKWSPHVDYTPSSFPSLQRKYFTKFWPKMLHKDPETKALQAQQTIDHINQQIQKYQQQKNFPDPTSPNSQQVNKTKEDIIKNFRLYCSQLKQDLNKIKSKEMREEEDSNEDSMSIENNQYQCLAGESQSEEEAIPFEDMLDMLEESGLPESFLAVLRDARNRNWKQSLMGIIESSLSHGPITTRRAIKWDEIKFPENWIIENNTPPKPLVNNNIENSESEDDNIQINRINSYDSKFARKPVQRLYYYPRPSPQDVLHEEQEYEINNSYSGKNVYEWNLDGYSERQIYNMVHRMLMYTTIAKNAGNNEKQIAAMIIAGFTGQLKGWWDNYLNLEGQQAILATTKTEDGVNTPNVVYTLTCTIIEHFTGRWSDNSENIRTLLNGMFCKTLTSFRWYKDTFLSRVMELNDCNSVYWKTKFIDGLPHLFAERVKNQLRIDNTIPYENYTYGRLIGTCIQEGLALCSEIKLNHQIKTQHLNEKRQLGEFCEQFGAATLSTTHCHHGHGGQWQWRSPERTTTRRNNSSTYTLNYREAKRTRGFRMHGCGSSLLNGTEGKRRAEHCRRTHSRSPENTPTPREAWRLLTAG